MQFYYSFFKHPSDGPFTWILLPSVAAQLPGEKEGTNYSCLQNCSVSVNNLQDTRELGPQIHEISANDAHEGYFQKDNCIMNQIKIKNEEEEYRPNVPEVRKGRRTPQNANRNVVPNIMHQVMSFIQKRRKSGGIVQRIIRKESVGGACSVKRFYLYQLLIKDKLNHYINGQSLIVLRELQEPTCEVYTEQEQRLYNRISRLLVHYFLTRLFDTIILTSKRVSSQKKLDHIVTKRRLLEQISAMLQA